MRLFLLAALLLACWSHQTVARQHFAGFGGATTVQTQVPGPSLALYSNPQYQCSTNYYVNVNTGSDSNNGTSSGTAWATLDHAATAVTTAGSCINVAAGIYPRATQLNLTNGGTSALVSGWIAWRCSVLSVTFSGGAPSGEGSGCVIRATSAIPATSYEVEQQANYVIMDGFEFDGTSSIYPNGCWIMYNGGNLVHHGIVMNSDCHGAQENGFASNNSDWGIVEHDIDYDNSSVYLPNCCGSGIHFYEPLGLPSYAPVGLDLDWCSGVTCYSWVAAYNVSYDNQNPPSSAKTDGVGVELDDMAYVQNTCPGVGVCPSHLNWLVLGNLLFNNGGDGFKCYGSTTSQHGVVANNTAYSNNQLNGGSGGIVAEYGDFSGCNNEVNINNIANPTVVGAATFSSSLTGSGNLWQSNLSNPGGSTNLQSPYPTTGANANMDGSPPDFISATPASNVQNLALQSLSPARSLGQPFGLWWTNPVDAGACPFLYLRVCP